MPTVHVGFPKSPFKSPSELFKPRTPSRRHATGIMPRTPGLAPWQVTPFRPVTPGGPIIVPLRGRYTHGYIMPGFEGMTDTSKIASIVTVVGVLGLSLWGAFKKQS